MATSLDNGITLVELIGRMDVPGALKADPAFAQIAGEATRVIVDLGRLEFLASLGIRTLVTTSKTLRAKDGNLVVLSPQPNVEQVLRSSGIDTIIPIAKELVELGFKIVSTGGTARHLQAAGLEVTRVNKVMEGRPHVVDMLKNGEISLIINTTEGKQSTADSFTIRRTTFMPSAPPASAASGSQRYSSGSAAIAASVT